MTNRFIFLEDKYDSVVILAFGLQENKLFVVKIKKTLVVAEEKEETDTLEKNMLSDMQEKEPMKVAIFFKEILKKKYGCLFINKP